MSFGVADFGHLSHHDLNHVRVVIGCARCVVDRDADDPAKEKVTYHARFHDRGDGGSSGFEAGLVTGDLKVIVGALDLNRARGGEKPFTFCIHQLTGCAGYLSGVLSGFNGYALLCAASNRGAAAQQERSPEYGQEG